MSKSTPWPPARSHRAAIAQRVGASRVTVYRYLHMNEPPARKQPRPRGSRLLRPYEAYLLRRWQEGCRNAKQLWRAIAAQGYGYSSHTVERFIGRLRQQSKGSTRSFRRASAAPPAAPRCQASERRPYTARQVVLLLTSPPGAAQLPASGYWRACARPTQASRGPVYRWKSSGGSARPRRQRTGQLVLRGRSAGGDRLQRFATGLRPFMPPCAPG